MLDFSRPAKLILTRRPPPAGAWDEARQFATLSSALLAALHRPSRNRAGELVLAWIRTDDRIIADHEVEDLWAEAEFARVAEDRAVDREDADPWDPDLVVPL